MQANCGNKGFSSLFTWSKQKQLFGGPAFIQPIKTIWKVFKKPWLAGKKQTFQKSHFWFDHVNTKQAIGYFAVS